MTEKIIAFKNHLKPSKLSGYFWHWCTWIP